jgi:hypothetical protein
MSDDRQLKQIEASLRDIRELHPRFEATIERLEKRLDDLGTGLEVSERIYDTIYLNTRCTSTYSSNCALSSRTIFASSRHYLSWRTVRYVFEALVWLRVLRKDERYGLVAHHQLGSASAPQAKRTEKKDGGRDTLL